MKAFAIGDQTCVGIGPYPLQFPLQRGNCFSLWVDGGKYYRVANFYVENLEELLRRGLTWPVEVKMLGDRNLLIHDPRIGERWYSKRYCEICCLKSALPAPQLDAIERDILRGARTEHGTCTSFNLAVKAEFE